LVYSQAMPIIDGASIGAHVRHILDFYSALFAGIEKRYVDYDDRGRDQKIERSLYDGLTAIEETSTLLSSLTDKANCELTINASVEVYAPANSQSSQSNLFRELQSLHSHTTHHMAIIAIGLKLNKINVDTDFGKAPSTIEYEQRHRCEQVSAIQAE